MEEEIKNISYISVEDILPNRFQPRLAFDEKDLNKLASSIDKYGIIQPIVLRKIGNGDKYEIIAGERRYKASVLAGLKKVPAIIKETDDNTSAEIALLENLQRKNLTPIEEAQSFNKLLERGFTQEEIAKKMGISQSTIANKLRLLLLPKKVQDALLYGRISERHARSLLSLDAEETQLNILDRIISEKLTVKQTEDEIYNLLNHNIDDIVLPEEPEDDEYNLISKKLQELISDVNNTREERIPNIVEINDFNDEFDTIDTTNIEEKIEKNNTINENINDNVNDINPFQLEKSNEEDELKEIFERKEIIISNKIRDCVNSLSNIDPNMRFNIIDDDNTFKIIIEIDKDTK